MAKSTHDKQLARAREKRRQDALERRRGRSRVIVLALVVLLVVALVGVALVGGRDAGSPVVEDEPDASSDATDEPTDETTDQDPEDADDDGQAAAGERPEGACPPTPDDVPEVDSQQYDAAPEMVIDEEATYTATIATTCGDIVVELEAAQAPVTVNNFVFLAEEGYYEGVGFHRVIDGFMIQGGDPEGTGAGGPGYTIPDEFGLAEQVVSEEGVYPRGALAMAKTQQPDSGGSQFFIIEAEDGYPLPPEYSMFGRVVEGQEVVEAIALGPVEGDQAVDPVVITSVTVETS